jgi:hypothetical protein
MADKCIISYASSGRENYNKAQLNMIRSCKNAGWDGDYLIRSLDGYVDEYLGVKIHQGKPVSRVYGNKEMSYQCYNHNEVPYQFKPYLIAEALELGYRKIIWCDSTVRMVKDPMTLFRNHKSDYGVIGFDNLGHPLHQYLHDYALERLEISEEDLPNVKQIMACVMLFDFTRPGTFRIFEEWMKMSHDGVSFQNYGSKREAFKVHRHDQACMSGLLHKYGVPLLPYGRLVYPPHDQEPFDFGTDIYFVNKGVN